MQASLNTYNSKRNFRKTAEPKGRVRTDKDRKIFVIQRHEASRLHYDFRLELGGVLKSWAIPKEPVLDPQVKRLAVPTEDHPLEYASFHGDIPQGEYGGGHVEIWDAGEWIPLDADPEAAFDAGRLNFEIHGKKLKGRFTLIQTKGFGSGKKNEKPNWLLIKNKDKGTESFSGEAVERISQAKKVSKKPVSGKSELMTSPQLAILVDRPPKGTNWSFEEKYDGYRILAELKKSRARLFSRHGNDWTKRFQIIADSLKEIANNQDLVLDGEVVALGAKGLSDFQLLQNSLVDPKKQSKLVYFVFDILRYKGESLESRPLAERKQILKKVLESHQSRHLKIGQVLKGKDPVKLWKKACAAGWEGIICKRTDRPYQHSRSPDWLKVKCKQSQEFVIAGFTEPQGSRQHFGALLLASRESSGEGELKYVGKVGTGFNKVLLKNLFDQLQDLHSTKSPFAESVVREKKIQWVQPQLIAQIEFHGWTQDGVLRQPSFKGLREDKSAKEIKIERTRKLEEVAGPTGKTGQTTITHPERVLFPEANVMKSDLAEYFEAVQSLAYPLVQGHPLALVRCPGGIEKGCFFQQQAKDSLATQSGLQSVTVEGRNGTEERLQIISPEGFLSLVQNGAIELHMWGSRSSNLEKPDQIVFDLDPDPSVPWSRVVQAVKQLLQILKSEGLQTFLKLTGGKGVHVHVPIRTNSSWEEVHRYAENMAKTLEAQKDPIFTSASLKKERKGLIYLDYVRNSRGVTFVAPYSPRAKPTAPVAAPIFPDELSAKIKPDHFTVLSMKKRLQRRDSDPWAEFSKAARDLPIAERPRPSRQKKS
jgi:bifunctional non-homologous end joining protein LigD